MEAKLSKKPKVKKREKKVSKKVEVVPLIDDQILKPFLLNELNESEKSVEEEVSTSEKVDEEVVEKEITLTKNEQKKEIQTTTNRMQIKESSSPIINEEIKTSEKYQVIF